MTTPQKPAAEDIKTLMQIEDICKINRDITGCLDDAYHLGRIRGRLEGAEDVVARISKATA